MSYPSINHLRLLPNLPSLLLLVLVSQLSGPNHVQAISNAPAVIERADHALGYATNTGTTLSRRTAYNATTGYDDPNLAGGSMITQANGSWPTDTGEPLNIIISAKSDARIFYDSLYDGGWLNFMLSTELATECLGEHFGSAQTADLGTGQGYVDEVQELRWDYGDQYIGSCQETFDGGMHLRYWRQNSSGAFFLAVSYEEDLAAGHNIVYNGYNLGRDWLVGNITNQTGPIDSRAVTNKTTYTGRTTFDNYTYETSVVYVSGLLANSGVGINHNYSVGDDQYPAIDGLVAVLTVQIVAQPSSATIIQAGILLTAITFLSVATILIL